MSEMSVNFGDLLQGVGSLSMEPVAKGEYDAVVVDAQPATTSTGKLMFKIRYEITQPGPQKGRKVYNNITLTTDNPNALRMFFVNMKAMGLEESYFATNPTPVAVAGALNNRTCRIVVDHQVYQGQVRENVTGLKATGLSASPIGQAPAAVPQASVPTPVVATPEPVAAVPQPASPAIEVQVTAEPTVVPASGPAVPPPTPF